MSPIRRGCLVVLLGSAWLGCARDYGTGGTPSVPAAAAGIPTPPPPVVLKEGSFGIPTAASLRGPGFKTETAGTLQFGLDWTATGNETTLDVFLIERSFEGPCAPGCEVEDLCPSSCRKYLDDAWVDLAVKPATLRTESAIKPGNYELAVTYYDPLDYLIEYRPGAPPRVTVSYQIVLIPPAAGATRAAIE